MAETTQYKVTLEEIAEVLLERENIKSGLWSVGVGYTMASVEGGPSPDLIRPGIFVAVDHLLLVRQDKMGPNVVDASKFARDTK